jgi:type IV pilus assembly protein PilO
MNNVKDFIEKLKNLNPKEIHNWPFSVLTFIGIIIVVMGVFVGYNVFISEELEGLDHLSQEETTIKKEYSDKLQQAINLNAYKKQLIDITIASDQLLKQLPDKSEIEKLLLYINQAGVTRGLKFEYFKPEQEVLSDYYAELPIKIKVTGTYASVGNFAQDISQLSRVVVLKDINLVKNENGTVSMDATAKTFRYLDDSEVEKQRAEKKKLKNEKDK